MKHTLIKIAAGIAITMFFGCKPAPKVNLCDCLNKPGYADPQSDYYKPCVEKIAEYWHGGKPGHKQMANYTVAECCPSYPELCERLKEQGYPMQLLR